MDGTLQNNRALAMNILWIPHAPARGGFHRRDQYFVPFLKEKHKIFTVTWELTNKNNIIKIAESFYNGLRFFELNLDGLDAFHVRRIPAPRFVLRQNRAEATWINGTLFRRDIKRIVDRCQIDLVIAAATSYMTGFPPFDLNIPLVFDYLDCGDWDRLTETANFELTYLLNADAAICISNVALRRAKEQHLFATLIPNGADVERMAAASGRSVRARYGLESSRIISLIGLTCSPRLYFLEAVLIAKECLPDLKCLLVGNSPAIESALARIPNAEETFVNVGPVPYGDIAPFFAASDVGMYPVDETPYYHAASPIKIFEYTAARKPVVLPRLEEMQRIGFPNLVFAGDSATEFSQGIVQAFSNKPLVVHEITNYDWRRLAGRLNEFIEEVARRGKRK